MKNKARIVVGKAFKCTLSLLLCVLFVIPSLSAYTVNNFDFSDSNENMYTNSVAPSILVELLTKDSYTDFEKKYLDSNQDYYLRYNTQISTDYVDLEAVGSNIFVTARVYVARTKNNRSIRWIPVSATCNGVTLDLVLTNGQYECQFSNMKPDTSYPIKVNYNATIEITPVDANLLVNKVYNDALDVKEIMDLYDRNLTRYNNNVKAYEEYQRQYNIYLNELSAYNQYLSDYSDFQRKVTDYEQYLKDYAEYESELEEYNNYLKLLDEYNKAYEQYQKELEAFKNDYEKYSAYLEYLAKVEKCEEFLKKMDQIFITSSQGHSMYETIIGGTVDTVLNNKDQLISYGGVSSEDIDNAGIATQSLRSLLRAYRSLTTNSARFEWYKTNHSLLLSSFIMLYSSLYSLMQNRAVYVEMTKREKTTRFYQFISQMYVICMNLDDSASLSKDWYIYDIQSKKNITLMQILEPDLYFEDTNNATPTNVSWPSEVEKVEIPTTTVVPEKPATMFEPYPPTVVSEPIPPEVIVQPVAPGVVLAPGAKPTQPALSTTQRSLLTELENGNIKNRISVTSKYDYKIETSINTFLTAADIYPFPVVTFVNYNGTVIVDLVLKDASEASKIRPDIPPSSYEMYTFEYWETTGGNRVDFNNVIRNLTIYPHFSTSVAQYTVTWVMKDKTITTKCAYGVVPECPESVNDYYDSEYKYTFECWDKDISPALGDTSYTAQYSKEKRIYEIEWIIDKSVYVSDCEFGVIPECPESDLDYYTLDGYYEFKGWDKPVSKVTENTKYTAVFERHDLVSEQNNNDYEIVGDSSSFIITAKNAANMFNITYLSILAAKNDMKISVVANDKCVVDIPSSVLKTNVNNGVSLKVEFNQISEESFTMLVEMVDGSGNTIDTNGLMVKIKETDVSNYKCYAVINGSREELSFFKQGEYLVLTLKDSQSDLIFEKKDDNQEDEYFTVNFYVDNNLYSSKKYKFGDKLEMPETPTKEETQEYTFSFTGWEPTVVSVVTKNVDYHGSFKQTKKAGSDDYNVSPHTTYFPVHLIIIAIVVIAGITVGTIFLVKFLKNKKRQKMD